MYDPIMRVFTVLEILQSRDSVSGAELAERLEVDLRTVQRYILRLKDLGIPVTSSPGVGGAYRLRPGFRLPPLLLTNEEAFALSLGLQALHKIGLSSFAPATEGALAKLTRVLPASLRESLHTTEQVIQMEPSRWAVPASLECLIAASSAIRNNRRLRFDYRSHQDEVSHREIEPYALMHVDDRWYLIGRCLTRQALRTFRLDRVSRQEMGAESFERPEDFDAHRYMAQSLPYVQSRYQIDLWIDMPIEEAEQNFVPWRAAVEAEDGGIRLRCSRDQLEMFAAMVLSTGRRVVIHSPDELREVFRKLAKQALDAADSV